MNLPPILNPVVYLNYLTPEIGAQYEVFRNVQIVALGIYVGDMLCNFPQEVKMMRSSGLTLSIIAYWIARLFALICLTLVVFSTAGPFTHCQEGLRGIDATYVITGAATSFLFLRRVQAVFFDNKAVRWSFTALWVAYIGVQAIGPIGSNAVEIADTKHCVPLNAPTSVIVGSIVPLVYDSLVFLFISYKLMASYHLARGPLTWRMFFSQPLSHRLPRSILQGGQKYYLVSVCSNVIVVLLFFMPTMPTLYRGITFIPGQALTSSMACHVFRSLFLEDIQAEEGSKRNATVVLTSVISPAGITSAGIVTMSQEPDQGVPDVAV